MPVPDPDRLVASRVEALRAFHARTGQDGAEIDVSGGVDSATLLCLLARALGPDRVVAVYSSIQSTEASRARAREVAQVAGVPLLEFDLSGVFDDVVAQAEAQIERAYGRAALEEVRRRRIEDRTLDGSLRSCLRSPLGRYLNRLRGGIRHGTGNEDEDRFLRFYQKGGDGEVDTNPNAMLSKGEVYQVAVALGVPRSILEAPPTPDLWGIGERHTDEDELSRLSGVRWTYSRVDPETGAYTRLGTIERTSRLLDLRCPDTGRTYESILFDTADEDEALASPSMRRDAERYGLTVEHLRSARRWERRTRHKANPNVPALGTRRALVEAGLLDDTLPLDLPADGPP